MSEQGEPIGHWLTRTCLYHVVVNAVRPVPTVMHYSSPVRQKLNHVSSVQFSSVTSLWTRFYTNRLEGGAGGGQKFSITSRRFAKWLAALSTNCSNYTHTHIHAN